jgi:hypothetical protein
VSGYQENKDAADVLRALAPGYKWDVSPARTRIGMALVALSIIGYVGLVVMVLCDLGELLKKDPAALPMERFVIFIGGHVGITITAAWFLYQLLKAAERMMLPSYYVDQVLSREPWFLSHLLGIKGPTTQLKSVKEMLEMAKDLRALTPFSEFTQPPEKQKDPP